MAQCSNKITFTVEQATLLDIYPPEEHGKSMAVFGLAAIMGPLIGPVLGGYLTENFSWHWVFLINLPLGIVSFLGLSAVMPDFKDEERRSFDMTGFLLLAVAVLACLLPSWRAARLNPVEALRNE